MTFYLGLPPLDLGFFDPNHPSLISRSPISEQSGMALDNIRRSQSPARPGRRQWAVADFETILPVQYYDCVGGTHVLSGEQKLLLAVLEDALRCYAQANNRCFVTRTDAFEVRRWFNDRTMWPIFSFESICVSLNIDSERLRKKLASIKPADFPRKHFHNRRRQVSTRGRLAHETDLESVAPTLADRPGRPIFEIQIG